MAKGKSKKEKKSSKQSATSSGISSAPNPDIHFGNSTFTLPNGDAYVGGFCAHKCGIIWRQGHGIYTTKDGHVYEGEWQDDKLIEEKEIVIKYPTGAEYYGTTAKNQYTGGGTYILENKMCLSCTFAQNKPVGTITLIDTIGRVWNGEAKADNALLLPENLFYFEIPDNRGIGVLKHPKENALQVTSEEDDAVKEESPLSDRDWEKIIFAKSTKTANDVDFTESDWCQKYLKFKAKRKEILAIVKETGVEGLTEEEYKWYEKYKKFDDDLKKKESLKLKPKKSSEVDLSVIDKFYSKEFKLSCPAVKIFYPSPKKSQDSVGSISYKDQQSSKKKCL